MMGLEKAAMWTNLKASSFLLVNCFGCNCISCKRDVNPWQRNLIPHPTSTNVQFYEYPIYGDKIYTKAIF